MISAAELWCQLSCQLSCLSRHQSGVESVTSSFLFAVCKGFLEARDQSRKGPRRCISEETVRCSFGFRLHSERQLSRRKRTLFRIRTREHSIEERTLPGSAVMFSGLSAPVNEEFWLSVIRCSRLRTTCRAISVHLPYQTFWLKWPWRRDLDA